MKRIIAMALCALFAFTAAEARTLYVDASRPNNRGNGLKARTAKKTIQAAINIARKGDTILVYPGTYAPIKTNNKKITIKSVRGKGRTKLLSFEGDNTAVALLGKTNSGSLAASGTSSKLTGFTIDGSDGWKNGFCGVAGGTVGSCSIENFSGMSSACYRSKLTACTISENRYETSGFWGSRGMGGLVLDSTLMRCRIMENSGTMGSWGEFGHGYNSGYAAIAGSTLVNCLVHANGTESKLIAKSTLLNCTVAGNTTYCQPESGDEWPDWESWSRMAELSKFVNCILRDNYAHEVDRVYDCWSDDSRLWYGMRHLRNCESGNTYKNTNTTNKNPKFVNAAKGNYRLKKGSYCINSGKLTKAQRKLVGSKDLAGRKRIRGKAIDRGCYEY